MNAQSKQTQPSYNLNCRMAFEPAALERLCQVVRIRGFRIANMAVDSVGEHLDINLILEGSRPIAMLQSQLEKLHTVVEVALAEAPLVRSRVG
ncbi:ACT domain-containing protein [Marinobacter sp. CHS3-4]|uniref:ACT domain-containing protein n=1 Tax=Marinobacter sp. CHS3-4 TaxID=3045174 RepID=UPI0024B5532F|nr:ACT domain-containing protein [Marinobacter sp. CHS3-4]MDI9246035.1 ACT domain-containing protein [Marinobacter sp. CHS3-4]